jgi:hypothetical protein
VRALGAEKGALEREVRRRMERWGWGREGQEAGGGEGGLDRKDSD